MQQFTPPANNHDGDGDWVLLLDASGSNPRISAARQMNGATNTRERAMRGRFAASPPSNRITLSRPRRVHLTNGRFYGR